MAKMFGELPKNIIQPEKTQDEIRPFLSQLEREDYEKSHGYEMAPKNFNVWMVQTEASRIHSRKSIDSLAQALGSSIDTNEEVNTDEQTTNIYTVTQSELKHSISNAFLGYGKITPNLLPDLVIVAGDAGYDDTIPETDLAQSYIRFEMQPIHDIRHAAEATLHHFFSTGEKLTRDWDQEFLQYHILGSSYHDIILKKNTIDRALAIKLIASSLFNETNHEWEISGKTFDEYARTGNIQKLRGITTVGRIQKVIRQDAKSSTIQHRIERYDFQKKHGAVDDGFSDENEFLKYQQALTREVQALATDTDPRKLQEEVFLAFKELIDAKKEEYLSDVENESAEEKLLQPLIIAVGKSQKYREASLVAGADATLPELSPEDTRKLVALAKRIRTSPASMATERLRRNKSEFYHSVVDQIEDRSRETADTEQELRILSSLFKKIDAKKILDVGCGYGRLAKPLAQEGFEVTGIDASRELLTRAKELRGKTKNLHYTKGDIINYKESIPKGSFDAVYYGWHSFLEAYGLGNALASLQSARHALKPDGVIAFDQPSRTNTGLEEGWYGDAEHGYLAYLMDEEEIKFMLRLAGFEDVNILHWTSKGSTLYPEGMQKITVVARKPSIPQHTEELREVA